MKKLDFSKNARLGIPLLVLIVMACFPFMFNHTYLLVVLILCGIYILVTSGLDVLYGYSGQISLGHAGFYAIGAYMTAILSKTVGLPPLLTIFIAAIIGTIIGVLFALPVSKLQFMFLSLVTTGFGEIVYQVIVNFFPEVTGSTSGFSGIPNITVFGFVVKSRVSFYYLILVFVVVMLFIKYRIVNSRVGRALIAIRESPAAAGAMGINIKKYKTIAFGISAFYGALGGALYAHFVGYISPETFKRPQSILFLTIVLFGGAGSMIGPMIGSVILVLITEVMQSLGSYQQLIYGLFIIVVVLFMPTGVTGLLKKLSTRLVSGIKKKVKG